MLDGAAVAKEPLYRSQHSSSNSLCCGHTRTAEIGIGHHIVTNYSTVSLHDKLSFVG